MAITTIIWLVVGLVIIIVLGVSVKGWISIYNKFQYWVTRAQRKFADVDVVMQERLDNIHALAQIAKKYGSSLFHVGNSIRSLPATR